MKKELFLISPAEESNFLNTYPLIRRITARGLLFNYRDADEDIVQEVIFKLWQWRTRPYFEQRTGDGQESGDEDSEKSSNSICLSAEEWQRFANTATRNEIKTFFTAKHQKEIPLPETLEEDCSPVVVAGKALTTRIEGSTEYELESQLRGIWRSLLNLTCRERYALILRDRTLGNRLIYYGCCKAQDIADVLAMRREEFIEIYKRLPVGDTEIARLLEKKLGQPVAAAQVTKARQRARTKIRQRLLTGNLDGYAHDKGKT